MENYTVPALREIAARMDINYTTKWRKAELVDEIAFRINVAHADALIDNALHQIIDALPDFSLSLSFPGNMALKRERVYKAQNGCDKLTPRQARRIRHKANRAVRAL